jgi:hypothetical protein
MSEARAMGDPAATAPVHGMPPLAEYRGGRIPPDEAATKQLACAQDERGMRCYDDVEQLNAAEHAGVRIARAAKARPKARTASQCSDLPNLQVFQYAQSIACHYTGNGWVLTLTARRDWWDLPGAYDNETSAYYMGNHSGHLSEGYAGGGYWCPFATGVGDYKLSLNHTGWSNRISSRYRN